MKLQKQTGKVTKNKEGKTVRYDRFAIVIPTDLVEALGWEAGLELTPTRRGDALTLRPTSSPDS